MGIAPAHSGLAAWLVRQLFFRAMSRTSPCLSLLIFFCLAIFARANWDKNWDRIQIDAHLLDSGAVEVVERMTAILDGDMDTLERPLSTGPDQAIVLRRLVREDAVGEQVLNVGDRRERDRYDFTDGVLTWGIGAPEGGWKNATLTFRLEYELRYALAPAWDIPLMPDRFGSWGEFREFPARIRTAFTKWREAGARVAKRYRYEHEIRFPPFPATGPRETQYNIKYDKAWRLIFPERDLGRGSEESYRVSLLFEFLQPGVPSAIELWKPVARLGSIALAVLFALALSAIWFASELRARGLWKGRINYAWFEQNIAPMRPEALARFGERSVAEMFPNFLARMRNSGVVAVEDLPGAEDETSKVKLRLMNESASLAPYEREVITRLFPKGRESGSDVLAEHYKNHGGGFDPRAALSEAVAEQFAEPEPRPPLLWRALGGASSMCFFVGFVLIMVAVFHGAHEWRAAMNALIGAFVLSIVPLVLGFASPARKAARSIFLPILIAVLLCAALCVQQFATNLPLTIWGSAGVALLCVALVMKIFPACRSDESPARRLRRRDAVFARRFIQKQLRRAQPALHDAWMPHIDALGLGAEVARWRSRPRDPVMHADFQIAERPPFTGTPPPPAGADWEDALTVSVGDEDEEDEDEEQDVKPNP